MPPALAGTPARIVFIKVSPAPQLVSVPPDTMLEKVAGIPANTRFAWAQTAGRQDALLAIYYTELSEFELLAR